MRNVRAKEIRKLAVKLWMSYSDKQKAAWNLKANLKSCSNRQKQKPLCFPTYFDGFKCFYRNMKKLAVRKRVVQ